jgi:cold shock CspA family protein
MEGTVRTIHRDKGFGFIRSEGVDHFFHVKDLNGLPWGETLEGRAVEFESQYGPKGLRAIEVRALD